MIDFVDQMEKLARDIHYRKQQHRVFSGTIPTDKQKSKTKSCWISERDFDDSDVKVLDHCHFKGNFLGWAHEVCNVNRKTQKLYSYYRSKFQSLQFTPAMQCITELSLQEQVYNNTEHS